MHFRCGFWYGIMSGLASGKAAAAGTVASTVSTTKEATSCSVYNMYMRVQVAYHSQATDTIRLLVDISKII